MTASRSDTQCCIVGGGPAGLMLGYLLARTGVTVIVLEKHADFLRDFRGDTIHPSTLELMHELGLLEELLTLPHQRVERFGLQIGDQLVPLADFRRLRTHARFIAMMPQWDFLDFLARKGAAFPGFRLLMDCEATGLIEDGKCVLGVRALGRDGPIEVHAPLVVGADGRQSLVRAASGLAVEERGAPIDVLWFRLSKAASDPAETMGPPDRSAAAAQDHPSRARATGRGRPPDRPRPSPRARLALYQTSMIVTDHRDALSRPALASRAQARAANARLAWLSPHSGAVAPAKAR